MTPEVVGLIGIALLFFLLAIRTPIGVALGLTGTLGLIVLRGPVASLSTLGSIPYGFIASWELSAVPMFLLMGAIVYHSGLAGTLFKAARAWLSFLPGGLAVSTNLASAGFAAASGSSVAMTGAMSRLAVPEMTKAGYEKGLAAGSVASAGTLGALIPPSIPFIIYGVFVQESIGKLLLAGLLPGILTMLCYSALIIIRVKLSPALAPRTNEQVGIRKKLKLLAQSWPIPVMIGGVVGGLYSGAVTATETGAFGASVALLASVANKTFSLRMLRDSITEAVRTTSAIFLIAMGAVVFTRFLILSHITMAIGGVVSEYALSVPSFLVLATFYFLIMGMFLDPVGLLLISLPILLPITTALDINMIWFGVLMVKFIEIGLLTPPIGLNLFVVSASLGRRFPFERIVRGTAWFLLAEAVVMVLLMVFPEISLFIPNHSGP